MSQLTSIVPESPPLAQIDYLTPVARPRTRALALVLTSIIAIVLVCAGGMMLFDILQLARDEPDHATGAVFFAGLLGMLSGIAFCGAGVIFYLVTRTLLRLTAT